MPDNTEAVEDFSKESPGTGEMKPFIASKGGLL